MRRFLSSLLLSLAAFGGFAAAQPPPVDLMQAEIEELRSVVRTLDDSNRKLAREKDELAGEIVHLRRALAQRELELADALAGTRASPPANVAVSPSPTSLPPSGVGEVGLDVVYVNPTWHYVILGGGTDKGVDVGRSGRILREGKPVASVKVTSVKPSQCVADIDLDTIAQRGQYPRPGDIVVFP